MPFDPSLPSPGSDLESAVMRAQFTGLKDLIDAVNAIRQAQVDGVTTVDPIDPAAVQVTVVGDTLHFTFGIPRGQTGPQGVDGPTGPPGPPFSQAVVDAVNTLNPGDPATVSVSFDGTYVHFTFGLPSGVTGPQGPPGEVTTAQLSTAIATTAQNPSAVTSLSQAADSTYNPTQMQQVIDKLDELLAAVKRV